MKISAAILVCSLVSGSPALVMGMPIAQWTFETHVQTAASADANATASSFTLSSGTVSFVTGNAPTAPTAISGTGWNVSDGVKWWDFTVTANAGYLLDLTSLTFDDQKSSTGPADWSVTINGVVAASNQATHGAFSTSPMNTNGLSAIAFQDLTSADVRIFGFGASGSSGTWRLDNVTLNGNVTQIPSVPDSLPSNFAAAALIGTLVLSRHFASAVQPEKQVL